MNTTQTLTPEHPFFENFCRRLSDALGGPEGCQGDHGASIEALNTLPNVDIDGSLKWFTQHGGGCDCEVMLNIVCNLDDLFGPAEQCNDAKQRSTAECQAIELLRQRLGELWRDGKDNEAESIRIEKAIGVLLGMTDDELPERGA